MLAAASTLGAQSAGVDAQVDRRIATWAARPDGGPDRLAAELAGLGRAARPRLQALLDAQTPAEVLLPVAVAFARIEASPASAATLDRLLADRDPTRRTIAAIALGEPTPREALDMLLGLLDDADERVRTAAAASIVDLWRSGSVPAVRERLQAKRDELTDQRTALALLQALEERDRAASAIPAAQRQVDSAIETWLVLGDESSMDLAEQLVAIGPGAGAALLPWLDLAQSPQLLERIASALAKIARSDDGRAALLPLLASPREPRRAGCAMALGELRDPDTFGLLIPLLDDVAPGVRTAAVEAMLQICEHDPEFDVLAWHEFALRRVVRKDGLGVFLRRLGTPGARAMLREQIESSSDSDSLVAGLHGLWLCPTAEDAPTVLTALEQGDAVVKRKACLVLGKMKATAGIRSLIDCLRDDHRGVVADAHWALCRITGLRLAADAGLWETWWQRVGHRISAR